MDRLDNYLSQSDDEAHPGWFAEHPEDQVHLTFPPEVNAFFTGNRQETEPAVLPLFSELDAEREAEFRQHARENYVPGDPISSVFHPVWQDEARKMLAEAGLGQE